MSIINAEFHSIWDGNFDLETACSVDLQTGRLHIVVSDDVEGLDLLDFEFVRLPGSPVQFEVSDESGNYFIVDLAGFRDAALPLIEVA